MHRVTVSSFIVDCQPSAWIMLQVWVNTRTVCHNYSCGEQPAAAWQPINTRTACHSYSCEKQPAAAWQTMNTLTVCHNYSCREQSAHACNQTSTMRTHYCACHMLYIKYKLNYHVQHWTTILLFIYSAFGIFPDFFHLWDVCICLRISDKVPWFDL